MEQTSAYCKPHHQRNPNREEGIHWIHHTHGELSSWACKNAASYCSQRLSNSLPRLEPWTITLSRRLALAQCFHSLVTGGSSECDQQLFGLQKRYIDADHGVFSFLSISLSLARLKFSPAFNICRLAGPICHPAKYIFERCL